MPGHSQSFTLRAPGRLREIVTQCWIAPAFDPTSDPTTHPKFAEFFAIWDTGATNTVISPKVVAALGLKQIGVTKVATAHETHFAEQFLVSIGLPNGVGFSPVRVTCQNLSDRTPVLIGMDIIAGGDFVITNKDGKTVCSFRFPSIEDIDFVKSKPMTAIPRNARCPCGSGKKYRNCCGAAPKTS